MSEQKIFKGQSLRKERGAGWGGWGREVFLVVDMGGASLEIPVPYLKLDE